MTTEQQIDIELILVEASAWGLNYEVDTTAKQLIGEGEDDELEEDFDLSEILAELSDEKEKWWTCKEFYFECDNLRDRYTNEKDEKKLKFLDEINEFVEGIQKKYEQA